MKPTLRKPHRRGRKKPKKHLYLRFAKTILQLIIYILIAPIFQFFESIIESRKVIKKEYRKLVRS